MHSLSLSLCISDPRRTSYRQELGGASYFVAGIVVVTIVACIAQNIVHLLNGGENRAARGDISFTACVVGLFLVVGSMENGTAGSRVLVTQEEVISYWYTVLYCAARIAGKHPRSMRVRSAITSNRIFRELIAGFIMRVVGSLPAVQAAAYGQRRSDDTLPIEPYVGVAKHIYAVAAQDQYYNLLPAVLQLLATR